MNYRKYKLKSKYGKLTIIGVPFIKDKRSFINTICDCGIKSIKRTNHVIGGLTCSCGCHAKEIFNKVITSHGLSKHPLYHKYKSMLSRCYNKNNKRYKDYGGRGIGVCKKWLNNFKSFYIWALRHGYKKYLVIDRINNYKGYSETNCRFVTHLISNRNRRNVKIRTGWNT